MIATCDITPLDRRDVIWLSKLIKLDMTKPSARKTIVGVVYKTYGAKRPRTPVFCLDDQRILQSIFHIFYL